MAYCYPFVSRWFRADHACASTSAAAPASVRHEARYSQIANLFRNLRPVGAPALRFSARQFLQPTAFSGCEDYAQIECRDHSGRRRSAAFENLVKQASVCARLFRPRDLAAGLLDFTPQQSDDVVQFEDLHISPCIVGASPRSRRKWCETEYEIVTATIAPPKSSRTVVD